MTSVFILTVLVTVNPGLCSKINMIGSSIIFVCNVVYSYRNLCVFLGLVFKMLRIFKAVRESVLYNVFDRSTFFIYKGVYFIVLGV